MEIRAAGAVGLRPSPTTGGSMFVGQIKYNRLSEPIRAGGSAFRELIAPSAFVRTLQSGVDVFGLRDHDPAMLLGRSSTGTLRMSTDGSALNFEIDPPATTYANDLAALLERGDVGGASFSFRVNDGGDSWSYTDGGQPLRTLTDVALSDVTICATPAYPTSTAGIVRAGAAAVVVRLDGPVVGGLRSAGGMPADHREPPPPRLVPPPLTPNERTSLNAEHRMA